MIDIVDKSTRSRMMAGIRSKHTRPELALRRSLHARGYRYRLHAKNIAGRPDLVFPRYGAVVFVDGCFWHHHAGCRFATVPATRIEFWRAKLAENVARDDTTRALLIKDGWRVGVVWECALRKPGHVAAVVQMLTSWLSSGGEYIEIGEGEVGSQHQ